MGQGNRPVSAVDRNNKGEGMEITSDRENAVVDLVKLLCVFVVVSGHCLFSDTASLRWLPRAVDCCVQILFLFSGYYAAKTGVLTEREKARRYTLHLMRMLGVWIGIYLIYGLMYADRTEPVWFYTYLHQEMEKLSRLDSGHLWYIEILILVVALLFCVKKTEVSTREAVGLIVCSAVFWNGLSRGLAGVAAGMWLAGRDSAERKAQRKGSRRELLVLPAGMISFGFVAAFHYTDFGMPYWLLQILIGLLLYVTALAVCRTAVLAGQSASVKRLPEGKIWYYVRKISTCVYLSHMLFIQTGIGFAARYAVWNSGRAWLFGSVCVAGISVAVCAALIWISGRRGFGWLKRLY